MRISDWSSDVCSSDLLPEPVVVRVPDESRRPGVAQPAAPELLAHRGAPDIPHPACLAVVEEPLAVPEELLGAPVDVPGEEGAALPQRSEERRVGKACVSTYSFRGRRDH